MKNRGKIDPRIQGKLVELRIMKINEVGRIDEHGNLPIGIVPRNQQSPEEIKVNLSRLVKVEARHERVQCPEVQSHRVMGANVLPLGLPQVIHRGSRTKDEQGI